MRVFFRWLIRLVSALLILGVASVAFVYYLASRSLPEYDADHVVRGISAPVEIVRNNNNVPHIFGDTDPDVYFGLGYAHAQDRLWQMMMLRRTAQGRLSEIFGARTRNTDELMRRLDIYRLAQEAVAVQDAETQAALIAYARGVNAYLDTVNDEALGRGAPELFLFSNEISPWLPADSIAVLKLLGVQLSSQIQTEVQRARVSLVLPPERVLDILPEMPGTGVAALPEYASLFDLGPEAFPQEAYASVEPDPRSPVAPFGMAGASNAWAAGPSRSAAGGSLLANDPHLNLSAPSMWYLARMELASGGVIGASLPGVPAILLGRSEGFAWGFTAAYADDQDLFIEEVNPENPNEVRGPDGWEPMRTRPSILRIADGEPETLTLRWTANGPVLPPSQYGLAAVTPEGHLTSVSWTLLTAEDTSMSAAIRLMQSQSVEDGLEAGADYVAPALNLVMIDQETVAMKTIGRIPRRNANHRTEGRLPAPGWESVNRWLGTESYASNPEFVDPTGGIVANTNNKTVERPFPLHVSYDWGDSQRIQRLTRLLQSREVHTRDSFIEAQLDTVSETARTLLPLVAADLWYTGDPAPDGTPERARQRALDLLANWNGEMSEHLPEPLIYSAWMRELQDRLIRDDLGPLANSFTHVEPLFIERVFRDVDGASAWCDVIQSAPVETCTDIARQALDEALIWIDETQTGEQEALRWGDAHEAHQDHAVLGNVPFLRWFVNIRQSTSGGDNTLNRGMTKGTSPDPFANVHAASYRGIYDLSDPDSSLFVISTGQSGHMLSRHYDDLGELWRRGEYIPMSLDPELARAAAVGITHLLPAAR